MKIKVLVDSAADLPKEYFNKYKIKRVPQKVIFEDGEELKLGEDISVQEYYKKLESTDTIPSSSAPNVYDFVKIFDTSLNNDHYDHVLYFSIASPLSSTYNNARVAAKKFETKVDVIDTQSASGVQGLLALAAVRLIEKSYSIKDILEHIEALIPDSFCIGGLTTLTNAYKSGRLTSKFVLYLTRFIGVKPIFVIERPGIPKSRFPGFFSNISMERRLVKLTKRKLNTQKQYSIMISHVNNIEGMERIVSEMKNIGNITNIYTTDCSPIIGTYAGPEAIVISSLPSLDL